MGSRDSATEGRQRQQVVERIPGSVLGASTWGIQLARPCGANNARSRVVLCCVVLCCVVLCCVVLCCVVLCCVVLCCVVLCCVVLCCVVLCCVVLWCGVVWCGVVWCGVWCGVVLCYVVFSNKLSIGITSHQWQHEIMGHLLPKQRVGARQANGMLQDKRIRLVCH